MQKSYGYTRIFLGNNCDDPSASPRLARRFSADREVLRLRLLLDEASAGYPWGIVRGQGIPSVPFRSLPEPASRGACVTARRLLVVADPAGDLPGAAAEGRTLARLAGEAWVPVTLLEGKRACLLDVLAALDSHAWLHFAGHARSGALQLADGRLDTALLRRAARLPAFVACNACHSADPAFVAAWLAGGTRTFFGPAGGSPMPEPHSLSSTPGRSFLEGGACLPRSNSLPEQRSPPCSRPPLSTATRSSRRSPDPATEPRARAEPGSCPLYLER